MEGGTGTLLDALSESDKLKETGLIDKDTVEKLKESGLDNLESTIGASQKSVSIIDQLTSENPDEASIKEDLQWLVDNMDDTTSDFITSQITADKLTSFGISPLSAPGVERFIKILTEEIKSAQDDPAVDSEKESAALVSVYTLAIGADTAGGDLFAEGKSDPQVLADSVFGSRIVGNTVVRTAIEDGKLTVDPIGCGISLSNADRNALVSAINTSLSAAGYASADAAAKQKLSDRAVYRKGPRAGSGEVVSRDCVRVIGRGDEDGIVANDLELPVHHLEHRRAFNRIGDVYRLAGCVKGNAQRDHKDDRNDQNKRFFHGFFPPEK